LLHLCWFLSFLSLRLLPFINNVVVVVILVQPTVTGLLVASVVLNGSHRVRPVVLVATGNVPPGQGIQVVQVWRERGNSVEERDGMDHEVALNIRVNGALNGMLNAGLIVLSGGFVKVPEARQQERPPIRLQARPNS
jgi:hypothetical protein